MINNVTTALEQFEEAAKGHGESVEISDYKAGNKYYKKIASAITYLKDQNQIEQLMKFIDHESIGVRLWTAAYLLPVQSERAVEVLNKIKSGNSIHSFTAETTLNEWEKGRLAL